MSNIDSTRKYEEALAGDRVRFKDGIPEGSSLGVLSRLSTVLNCVSFTQRTARSYPTLKELLHQSSSATLDCDRVFLVNLLSRITDSSTALASTMSVAATSMFKLVDSTPKE